MEVHPSRVKYQNDIALVTLDRDVPFSAVVRPICTSDEEVKVKPGDKVLATGWGAMVDGAGRRLMASSLQFVWLGRSTP